MASNILVLGAGELGLSMLSALAYKKPAHTKITVFLRPDTIKSPSAAKATEHAHLRSLNISLLVGDIATSSISELAIQFKPYDLVISCLGYASGPGSQIKIAQAVLQAGVERFIPWQFGIDYDLIGRGSAQDLFDEQLDIRDLLRAQEKTEWIIVSTGLFTSFLFESFFGVVDLTATPSVVRALGSWDEKVTVTTPEDIGRLTAEIVFTEPRVRNEVVFIAGETISYRALANLVEEVLGTEIRREEWSSDMMKESLRKDPEDVVKKYRAVFAAGKGVAWGMEKTFNFKKGIQVEDIRSWMLKNVRKGK